MSQTKPKDVSKELKKLRNQSRQKKRFSESTVTKYGMYGRRIEPLPKR